LAAERPRAIALLQQFAQSNDPRIAAQAERILRKHAPHLSPIIERYADTQQRKRAKE
jgi:hypothetical protein